MRELIDLVLELGYCIQLSFFSHLFIFDSLHRYLAQLTPVIACGQPMQSILLKLVKPSDTLSNQKQTLGTPRVIGIETSYAQTSHRYLPVAAFYPESSISMGETINWLSVQPHGILCPILRQCRTRWYGDYESKICFEPSMLRTFIDIMPGVAMSEVLEVWDTSFDLYYRRLDLIALVTKFATSSRENAAKIGLYGESLTSLYVWTYSSPTGEDRRNCEDILERILVPRGSQLLSLHAQVKSLRAANFVANNCTLCKSLSLTCGHRTRTMHTLRSFCRNLENLCANWNLLCSFRVMSWG